MTSEHKYREEIYRHSPRGEESVASTDIGPGALNTRETADSPMKPFATAAIIYTYRDYTGGYKHPDNTVAYEKEKNRSLARPFTLT